jgi:hypothetical protein
VKERSGSFDLMTVGVIRRLVKLHFIQFLFVLPVLAVVVLASLSLVYGVRQPSFNFGLVLTWVVWWG